jgi:3-hydroxyisobutyrate dehydrogenase
VRAWNRSRKRAEPLAEHGAVIAGSPAEAAAHADAVLTLLADADAVLPVASEAFVEEQRDYQPLWPQMSTIGEQGTKRCGN